MSKTLRASPRVVNGSTVCPVDNDVYAVGVPRGVGVEPRRRCLWTVRGQLAARPGSPGQTLSPACGRRIVVPVLVVACRLSSEVASSVVDVTPPHPRDNRVQVVRSARRQRTVSAYRDGDRTVVRVPAWLSRAEEEAWVATMLQRLARSEARRRPADEVLRERALALSRQHLDGRAVPAGVRWVSNQGSRRDSRISLVEGVHEPHRLPWLLTQRTPATDRSSGATSSVTHAASEPAATWKESRQRLGCR